METKRPTKKRSTKHIDPYDIMDKFKLQIKESGYSSMKVSSFFHKFGHKKRGPANIESINMALKKTGLFAFPKIDISLRWNRLLRIYDFPVESLGDLFKNENQLEDYIMQTKAYKQFDIIKVEKQYRPISTKDRLDFKGIDKDGKHVVLELKNKEGGKSAVEQVLRYAGMLKQENPKASIRKILVTGVRGVETAKAIHGMSIAEKDGFEWYLYNYNADTKGISFERVTHQFIAKHLP